MWMDTISQHFMSDKGVGGGFENRGGTAQAPAPAQAGSSAPGPPTELTTECAKLSVRELPGDRRRVEEFMRERLDLRHANESLGSEEWGLFRNVGGDYRNMLTRALIDSIGIGIGTGTGAGAGTGAGIGANVDNGDERQSTQRRSKTVHLQIHQLPFNHITSSRGLLHPGPSRARSNSREISLDCSHMSYTPYLYEPLECAIHLALLATSSEL